MSFSAVKKTVGLGLMDSLEKTLVLMIVEHRTGATSLKEIMKVVKHLN